jgi:CDGSH-type Zn-finger protein
MSAARTERLWLCGCKRSADRPRCDGSHKRLPPVAQPGQGVVD